MRDAVKIPAGPLALGYGDEGGMCGSGRMAQVCCALGSAMGEASVIVLAIRY